MNIDQGNGNNGFSLNPGLSFGSSSGSGIVGSLREPVIAKRHYHETGTMRWMNMALCRLEDAPRLASKFKPNKGEFGLFRVSQHGAKLKHDEVAAVNSSALLAEQDRPRRT